MPLMIGLANQYVVHFSAQNRFTAIRRHGRARFLRVFLWAAAKQTLKGLSLYSE